MNSRKRKKEIGKVQIGHQNCAHELQASRLAVAESDQENGGSDLREHAEVNEFQKTEKRNREGPHRPVRQIGNGLAVKKPLVHCLKCRIVSEVETNRGD